MNTTDASWRHVPVRLDAGRWVTRQGCKKVLGVAHTVTSAKRVIEAARLFAGDLRVQVVFTAAPDVFSNGVAEFLGDLRAVVLPWHQATEIKFDLAIAAAHGDIHAVHAPTIVLPHGAGHNKFVPGGRRGRAAADREVYGLNRQWLIRDGAVVPDTIVLAHEEELVRLARDCPEALPAAAVVGDPYADRIMASLRSRDQYRAALRVGARNKLVVVSSTWGAQSLLGQVPQVLDQLVAELPRDEFRVVVMLHPNAWNAHGEWMIETWLADLRRCGLQLVSQYADELAPLTAADYVVCDHGSMALYATLTGVPVLLGAFSDADVAPDSPMAELASFAPRLTCDRPLRKQLDRSRANYRSERYARVAARISSEPGHFANNMRALLYRKLGLEAPAVRSVMATAALPFTVGHDDPEGMAA